MKTIKSLLFLSVVFISTLSNHVFADNAKSPTATDIGYIKEQMLGSSKNTIIDGVQTSGQGDLSLLDAVLKFFKDSLFALTAFIVIATFVYMGIRLLLARGKPDELSKVMTQFVYVVVGIFVISVAFAAVKLVAGLTIQ